MTCTTRIRPVARWPGCGGSRARGVVGVAVAICGYVIDSRAGGPTDERGRESQDVRYEPRAGSQAGKCIPASRLSRRARGGSSAPLWQRGHNVGRARLIACCGRRGPGPVPSSAHHPRSRRPSAGTEGAPVPIISTAGRRSAAPSRTSRGARRIGVARRRIPLWQARDRSLSDHRVCRSVQRCICRGINEMRNRPHRACFLPAPPPETRGTSLERCSRPPNAFAITLEPVA